MNQSVNSGIYGFEEAMNYPFMGAPIIEWATCLFCAGVVLFMIYWATHEVPKKPEV